MLRLAWHILVQLYIRAPKWQALHDSLWGPPVKPGWLGIHMHEGSLPPHMTQAGLQQLRLFRQPFALGGIRLAYHAIDPLTGHR